MAVAMDTAVQEPWTDQLVEMYTEHFAGLASTAWRTVRCEAVAEEVVQEAFVMFHTRDCSPQAGRELAYLRSIVVNQARSITRRRIRGEELTVPQRVNEPLTDERCMNRLDAEEVRSALGALPLRQQQVLRLRYECGLRESEIADRLDISRGSVKVHASRGRDALRAALESKI